MSDVKYGGGIGGTVDGPPRSVRASAFQVPADMTVYAALVGRQPEIDPTLADPVVAATAAVRANPWSPGVLGVYVREVVWAQRVRLNRPEVSAWIKRQSAVARRRLAETKSRMAGAAVTLSPTAGETADE